MTTRSMPSRAAEPLTLAQGTCLSLVAAGGSHGWALVRHLGPNGDIGRIWSLSRPLTYRAIDQLVDRRLIRRTGTVSDGGPARALLAVTAAGDRAARRWLATPVEHLRDTRTEVLIKLELGRRLGLDLPAMLDAQQAAFAPIIEAIGGRPEVDLVDVWRSESSTSVQRFLERARAFVESEPGEP